MENSRQNIVELAYNGYINTLRKGLKAVKENVALLILCVVITSGVLLVNHFLKADNFVASFTVTYDELVRKIYGDRLSKINVLVQRQENDKVASFLGLDEKTASALVKVSGKNILGEDLTSDLNTDRIPFIVEMVVTDSSAILALQAGLLNFLEEGNAYSAQIKALKIKEIDDEITFIDKQLSMMDTLKMEGNLSALNGGSQESKETSLTNIYNFSYELYKKRQQLLRKKTMPGTLQVIDDAIAAKKAGMSIAVTIALGLVSGLFLFLFVLVFIKPVFYSK